MIDASIPLGVRPMQVESPMNQLSQVLGVQAASNQNALAQYGLAKAQRQDDETNKLAQLLSGGGVDPTTPEGQQRLYSVAPTQAAGYIKGMLDNRNTQAQIGERTSQAKKYEAETQAKSLEQYRNALSDINDPQSAAQWLKAQYQDPIVGPVMAARGTFEQAVTRIPTDPAGFQQWRQQAALGMTKFIELNKPQTTVVNAGGTSQVLQTPGLGGQPQIMGTVAHTVSPDAQLQANTSTANNQRTIAAENLRAGVTPGGGMDENAERTAQAIAAGQLPAPTGMALLNPKNQRILGRVMEINPEYDATTVSAKKAAATAFTTGSQGNAMRSFQVAGQHLDQLGQLVDALNNGNAQLVNKIGNIYSQQTGSPAVTNFDAAKDVVSKEVVKAIVAGGGGVAEREELSKLMDSAKSPAQLKGVIQQYRNLMGAQHEALLQQRDAAGLPRSTLPNYNEAGGSAAAAGVPADIAAILQKHGPRKGM